MKIKHTIKYPHFLAFTYLAGLSAGWMLPQTLVSFMTAVTDWRGQNVSVDRKCSPVTEFQRKY